MNQIPNLDYGTNDSQKEMFHKKYRSYLSDLKLYLESGASLPTTSNAVIHYLIENQHKSPITLRRHLSSISWWHRRAGHHDITKNPDVIDMMTYVASENNRPQKQAPALYFHDLKRVIDFIDTQLEHPLGSIVLPSKKQLKLLRDRAIFCVGWWRAFRSSDISQILLEHLTGDGDSFTIYVKKGKGDRNALGMKYPMQAVSAQYYPTCPVDALNAWLVASQLETGPVFPSIQSMFAEDTKALSTHSINKLVKHYTSKIGLNDYTSHSLRAGFVSEFQEKMSITQITEYVNWSSIEQARRYQRGLISLPFTNSSFGVQKRQ